MSALAHLIEPMSVEEFVARYWQRLPLHITGRPGHFDELFHLDALLAAVARQDELGLLIRVSGDREGDGGGAGAHVPVRADELADAFDRGASVCVDPIDRADERVGAYAAALKRELGHAGAVSVKCYLSPRGYGFHTHLDAHVVTTLQIEGRKRWRFSPQPGVREPLDNAFVDGGGQIRYQGRPPSAVREWERPPVAEDSFEEVVLEPGDLLCLPAGTWHNAKARERSLALNIAFEPLSAWDLLAAALRPRLTDRVEWRACVPADNGGPARDFVAARVRELAELLDGLGSGDPALDRAWNAAVAGSAAQHASGINSPAARAASRTAGAAVGELGFRGGLSCALTVSSLPDAIAWYESRLGWSLVASVPEFGWAELATATPGVRVGLSEIPSPGVTGGAVLNFGVADVEAARARLEAGGVSFDGPTREIAGMTRLAAFHDPDGNRLMLHES